MKKQRIKKLWTKIYCNCNKIMSENNKEKIIEKIETH